MEIEAIEKSAGSARAIPVAPNFSLAAMHLLVSLYLFFFLPLFLLPLNPWWSLTILPVVLFSNPFWSLIHEAIHDMFHPVRRTNWAMGRLLSIFFGSPFRLLRVTHLMHHKFNRTPIEGTEIYDPAMRSKARAGLGYYCQIFGGLYLLELVSPLPFFLPQRFLRRLESRFFNRDDLSGILLRSLLQEESVREMRLDGAAVVCLLGLSAFCYGGYWPLLVAAFMLRAFFISFLDNVYHYATPVNDIFYAKNLRLPGMIAKGLLYFNLHGVHHCSPAIPWIGLAQAFDEQAKKFDGDYFIAAVRQLRGPAPFSALPDRSHLS